MQNNRSQNTRDNGELKIVATPTGSKQIIPINPLYLKLKESETFFI